MIDPASLSPIATIGKPIGYKGDFNVPECEFEFEPEMFVFIMADNLPVPWRITSVRPKGLGFVLHLRGVESDSAASKFTGLQIFVNSDLIEFDDESEEGIVYLSDLIGYSLVDGGVLIGTVDSIDDSTENILFRIITPSGKEILVPATDDFIDDINEDTKTIITSLPQGLIDLN